VKLIIKVIMITEEKIKDNKKEMHRMNEEDDMK